MHSGLHPSGANGSPSYPGKQEQRAWPIVLTSQIVYFPHGDGLHGSTGGLGRVHCWKGLPVNPGLQLHSSRPPITEQSAFGPHGPGLHNTGIIGGGRHPGKGGGFGINPLLHSQSGCIAPY